MFEERRFYSISCKIMNFSVKYPRIAARFFQQNFDVRPIGKPMKPLG